ncbi:putative transmembrane protein [Toxoplasma gondii TgCatPRC2]|uniref:Transmembrane protein n=4 Tax=Toxoplasma gondii TaxID=5811 RepID=S8G8X0_TOXGM|nr:hypothetical protein TGME49_217410 [Toxoplasma gondii ME49]ESS34121.1 putative transmembrane protein [Toxoplasma gondii VEG]KYF48898.1 hypothetical protein TGARI_217410 [Toxoplasma gondii ARI]KYK67026.1 putative transmembrane protein [Toxoplasma gondii TgCatPRC2]EPT24719.1 hypothetical protein TGME49_217410 [Toxoplasma gondii ME49]CEL78203.1 TPA: hypothetical protein BN1205_007120 [Toxoplasma gondii VEG]|eukprot:XP_018634849.1 hypothetical protein TGME49_217410 [Toxoplasma gondii ME49]
MVVVTGHQRCSFLTKMGSSSAVLLPLLALLAGLYSTPFSVSSENLGGSASLVDFEAASASSLLQLGLASAPSEPNPPDSPAAAPQPEGDNVPVPAAQLASSEKPGNDAGHLSAEVLGDSDGSNRASPPAQSTGGHGSDGGTPPEPQLQPSPLPGGAGSSVDEDVQTTAKEIFDYFVSGHGEQLLTCAEWQPRNMWPRLTRRFCRRFRSSNLVENCEQAAVSLQEKMKELYIQPGPNPVPEVMKGLGLQLVHPTIPRGETAASINALGQTLAAVAASDVSRVQANIPTQTCSARRILERLGRKDRRERRKHRRNADAAAHARRDAALRYLLFLDQVPEPDPVLIGLVVHLVDMKPCWRRTQKGETYPLRTGPKLLEVRTRDAISHAFAGALLTAFYKPTEQCQGDSLPYNCAVLLGSLQARDSIAAVAEKVVEAASEQTQDLSLSNSLPAQEGGATLSSTEIPTQDAVTDALLHVRLRGYYTTRTILATAGKTGSFVGFLGRSKIMSKLVAKIITVVKPLVTRRLGSEAELLTGLQLQQGESKATRDFFVEQMSATVICGTGRIGLGNVTSKLLYRILGSASPLASGSETSTSFLNLESPSLLDFSPPHSYVNVAVAGGQLPRRGVLGASRALAPVSLVSLTQKKGKNKSWSRQKPSLFIGGVLLMGIAVGCGVGFSFLWAAPWAATLAAVAVAAFLIFTVLMIIIGQKASLHRWFLKGARAGQKAQKARDDLQRRRQQLQNRVAATAGPQNGFNANNGTGGPNAVVGTVPYRPPSPQNHPAGYYTSRDYGQHQPTYGGQPYAPQGYGQHQPTYGEQTYAPRGYGQHQPTYGEQPYAPRGYGQHQSSYGGQPYAPQGYGQQQPGNGASTLPIYREQ